MDAEIDRDIDKHRGLSEEAAKKLLAQFGPNIIYGANTRNVLNIVKETLREPTFLLLIVAAGLYLVLGSLGEGLFVSAGAVISLSLVIFQEARSERALKALQALAEPYARVVRDGDERRIPARELVPGDIVLVAAGERIPIDGRIISDGRPHDRRVSSHRRIGSGIEVHRVRGRFNVRSGNVDGLRRHACRAR